MSEYFLIKKDVAQRVSEALKSYKDHVDEDCARTGCMCDLAEQWHSQWISNLLHDFDTGLNTTEATPRDFSEEGGE